MHARAVIIIFICLLVAACGRVATGHRNASIDPSPEYMTWTSQAEPYQTATEVRLVVDNNDFDREFNLIERPETVRVLSGDERAKFEKTLYRVQVIGPAPEGDLKPERPACFVPHHFFRYYDRSGKQLGEIAVCFCCYQAQARPELPFEEDRRKWLAVDMLKVEALVKAMGLSTQQQCGGDD